MGATALPVSRAPANETEPAVAIALTAPDDTALRTASLQPFLAKRITPPRPETSSNCCALVEGALPWRRKSPSISTHCRIKPSTSRHRPYLGEPKQTDRVR